jgi:hypothetical protein
MAGPSVLQAGVSHLQASSRDVLATVSGRHDTSHATCPPGTSGMSGTFGSQECQGNELR